ncbi:arylsulfatase [Chitinophaga alhagiae]|uniref:Arylsulfatase n=1 Tax=Chitinophaga alhagiae TaxID=2203219 RepID=A0ABN5LMT1_9BACT|nr:sulfatase [Chitinophaga alhagiae]AWO00676.1 arylsulfatase [Chitinophaga alhagiae]
MKPYYFLTLLYTAWLLPAAVAQNEKGKTHARPNIIYIYTDDQRYDAMSVVQQAQGIKARFPWFKTPNMDRIAKEGVRFSNAFVVNSLCSPSRATMLTGRYNHLNGVTNNHTELADTTDTYATALTAAGYVTAFFGKWHMARQQGKRPGFTHSFSFVGQGRYIDCPFELNGERVVETKGWVDDVSTDSALAFIRRCKDTAFQLSLAFKSSHYNWTPPERLAHRFDHVPLKKPVNEKANVVYRGKIGDGRAIPPPPPAPASWAETNDTIIRKYFTVLAAIDENVGRVLNLLDSLHLTENTVVVYSSDNGYFLGERNLSDKRAAYEESLRVPLLVRYPAKLPAGKVIDKIVLNVDLAPTFTELAGAPTPKSFQGNSWLPIAMGKPVKWRTSFFYEYFYETPYAIPTIIAERTQHAKLIYYPGQPDWSELYDLKNDPGEKKNLYNNPRAARLQAEMTARFKKDSAAVKFFIPDIADKRPLDEHGRYLPPVYLPEVRNTKLR